MLEWRKGTEGENRMRVLFLFSGSLMTMNVWLCCVRLVSLLCLYALSYLYFTTTCLLKRLSKYILHGTAWLITAKYKGNEQNTIRTNCSGRSRSLRSLRTSLWNCSHVPSASENGLQQSTVWTGWQDGLMLEENTPKPNNNRFHPSNSHLLCRSGLEQRTLPPYLPFCLQIWSSVRRLTRGTQQRLSHLRRIQPWVVCPQTVALVWA